ncbi:actin maturation protease-like [Agelaius phoeniceus]|uniref:actin maturation protease-like n=1 Tax=Agelaius phoeniceus TaxID=39638 RepID=UPI004054E544
MERAPPPPPPPPPLPPPPGSPSETPGTPGSRPGLGRVLREALERAGEALGEDGGLRELLRRRRDSRPFGLPGRRSAACRAELLQGGLGGPNRARLLQHLLGGGALLVPYPLGDIWGRPPKPP